ncbi:M56 family metallopeptidase [Catenovulum agarivorans]|uniref:M56 family metallopeptidase n=1 Tax=Catenovulum agarivorans TaxID=1172192 RepID=UPI000369A38A|nr:M56 family metallopeptidase [Catenovulum agarivorans]
MDYLITNSIISILLLLTAKLLTQSPAKLRLAVLMVALLSWFIPWSLIELPLQQPILAVPEPLNIYSYLPVDNSTSSANSQLSHTVQSDGWQLVNIINLELVLKILFTIGTALFVLDLINYRNYLNKLSYGAHNADELLSLHNFTSTSFSRREIKLSVSPDAPAGMTTGVIHPVIWLNEKSVQSEQIHSILLHELTHIRHFDPAKKWVCAFSARLFFWNPLVQLLVQQITLLIEFSCDETCYKIKNERYSLDLAQIMLVQSSPVGSNTSLNYISTIESNRSNNIQRLKSLNKEKTMKVKYLGIASASIFICSLASAHINSTTAESSYQALQQLAIQLKAQKQPNQLMSIYLEDVAENRAYNQQLKTLVELSKNSLNPDVSQLDQTYTDIETWLSNRPSLSPSQERRLLMQVTSIQHFLLQQQGKNQQIVELISNRYGTDINVIPLFYRHHLATAYLKLDNPEKALEITNTFDLVSPRSKLGTLQLVALVYAENYQYEQALQIVEARLFLNKAGERQNLLNMQHALLINLGNTESADEVAQELLNTYAQEQPTMALTSAQQTIAWSPILDHI